MPHLQAQLRVLIVRLGAMGDILHALPAVTALRAAHPDWYVGWAVEPRWRALLCADAKQEDFRKTGQGRDAAMPLVDRIHRVGAKRWSRNLYRPLIVSEIVAMRSELRAEGYDVALDLQGAVRSGIIGLWSNAPRRVGEAVPREYPARVLFTERVATQAKHVIDQACEVASAVRGDVLRAVTPCLPEDEDAEAWCDSFLADKVAAPLRDRLVLMNPGAGWGSKRWPPERYGEVAAMLRGRGYAVVINTGPGETILAGALTEASGNTAILMECNLGQLISITRRASLMIAGDTGPLHLASALGKPVVGIFGPTDPARNGPYTFNGSNFRVLRSPESQRDHARRLDPEAGLLTITSQDVFEAAIRLLGENGIA